MVMLRPPEFDVEPFLAYNDAARKYWDTERSQIQGILPLSSKLHDSILAPPCPGK